jgi:membrane-bound serine protease (ClpP class)
MVNRSNIPIIKRLFGGLSLLFENCFNIMLATLEMKLRSAVILVIASLWGGFSLFAQESNFSDEEAENTVAEEEINNGEPVDAISDAVGVLSETDTSDTFTVYVIPIKDAIGQPTLFGIRSGVKDAIEKGADLVLFEMDTPGGELFTTLEIMKIIDRFDGKTATFINEEAISAGAIIASVTQDIYFMPRATMGSSEVVTGTGEDVDESMKRKINAFLNAKIDAYISEYPYRSQVLEAMVDPDFVLTIDEKEISKEGKLLNLNARRAHELYGDPPRALLGSGIFDDIESVIESVAEGKTVVRYDFETTWSLELAAHLVSWSPLLLGLGILALLVEFKTPGFGVFGIAGILFIVLVNFGHNIAGLSGYEGLLLFIVGALLVFVELLFLPGVMFLAIPGILMMLAGLLWGMADIWPTETPDFEFTYELFLQPFYNLFGGVTIAIVLFLSILRFLPKSVFWDKLIMKAVVQGTSQKTVMAGDIRPSIGAEGVAVTDLFPSGEIEIDGMLFEARTEMGSVSKGASVRIIRGDAFGYFIEEIEV